MQGQDKQARRNTRKKVKWKNRGVTKLLTKDTRQGDVKLNLNGLQIKKCFGDKGTGGLFPWEMERDGCISPPVQPWLAAGTCCSSTDPADDSWRQNPTFTFFTLPLVMVDKVLEMRRGVRPRKRPLFPSTSTMCLAGWDNTICCQSGRGQCRESTPKQPRGSPEPHQAGLGSAPTPRSQSKGFTATVLNKLHTRGQEFLLSVICLIWKDSSSVLGYFLSFSGFGHLKGLQGSLD